MRLIISSWLSEIIPKLASPLTFYVIAKYLGPEQYGIATTILVFISFTRFFWDWGLSKLIQLNEYDTRDNIKFSLYLNVSLSIFISFLVIYNSHQISYYLFGVEKYNVFIKISSIIIIFMAASLIPVGVLLNQNKYNIIKNSQIIYIFIYLVCVLILVNFGYGFESVIYATILSQIFQSTYLLLNIRIFLSRNLKNFEFKRNFGNKAIFTLVSFNYENFIVWSFIYLDFFLIASKLNQQEIGFYRASLAISITIVSIFGQSFFNYIFQSIKNDKFNLKNKVIEINMQIYCLVWSITILVLFNINILEYILGKKWVGIGFVLQITLSCIAIGYMTECNSELFKIISKSHYYSLGQTISTVTLLLLIYYSQCADLKTFLIIKLVISIIAVMVQIYIQFKVFALKLSDNLKNYGYLILTSILIIFSSIILQKNNNIIMYGVIESILFLLFFYTVIFYLYRQLIISLFNKLLSKLR